MRQTLLGIQVAIPCLRERRMAMITFAMIGVLAALMFLCVASSIQGYSGRRLL